MSESGTSTTPEYDREWWKEAVVYQIYPRSFNDSNGDGVGDIPGIVEKLDYLDELGVDVVWLNPVYESPGVDNGYDIADYRAINDRYGTMADWEELLAGLHDRDMRLIMDLVVNHTSDEHAWFQRSRSSRDSEYRDYYIWREGRSLREAGVSEAEFDASEYHLPRGVRELPPNDWESFFGGSAWTYDEETGEWYLHLFDERQPDLNWQSETLREEIYEMMGWWLQKGIDGFRMDVINLISKPEGLPDGDDSDAIVRGADQFVNGPNIHEYISEMHDRVLSNYDAMTVGEMAEVTVDEALRFSEDGMSMVFNFDHLRLDFGPEGGRWTKGEWTLDGLRSTLTEWQEGLEAEGWNSLHFNNHDEPRMVSRFGDDGEYRRESAKLLATLLLTLKGTPFMYQGEEIGMQNYPFSSLTEVRDVDTLNNVRFARESGRLETDEEVLELVQHRSRDNARTPMQWHDDEHAGFTNGTPWMPVNPNYTEVNVAAARRDERSVHRYYRHLLSLRDEYEVFVYGDYTLHTPDHEQVWAYSRVTTDAELFVVLNFDGTATTYAPPADVVGEAELLASNYGLATGGIGETLDLSPWEARVYLLDDPVTA
ncbi:oligo-1,6-glucosidase [Halopelagius inordinatus]|uniref:Oligo-1,6-glucosidase n=1 Tax=Halopelagius inordinatus TaxID=553467 RepID=A0A1I2N908_9EURY|nr:alpha-glucosidase [Halopelagius inordinatus]SFF99968.1 oligo-1,6-glucosidase [Halopelagius inordinatus]